MLGDQATKGFGAIASILTKKYQLLMGFVFFLASLSAYAVIKLEMSFDLRMYCFAGIGIATILLLFILSIFALKHDLVIAEKQSEIQKKSAMELEDHKSQILKEQAIEQSLAKASEKALEWINNPPNVRKLAVPMGNGVFLELKTIRQKKVVLIRNGNQVVGKFDLP